MKEAVPDHAHFLFLYLQVDKIFRETCSQGGTLKRDHMRPGRTFDINQKYDRPLPDLFNFTALLLGIHVQLIQIHNSLQGLKPAWV